MNRFDFCLHPSRSIKQSMNSISVRGEYSYVLLFMKSLDNIFFLCEECTDRSITPRVLLKLAFDNAIEFLRVIIQAIFNDSTGKGLQLYMRIRTYGARDIGFV